MDLKATLLQPLCRAAVESGADPAWRALQQAIDATEEQNADLRDAVSARDARRLATLLDEWRGGRRPLPDQDKAVFKRAMKAFRKRLKLTRLDAESSLGGGPMSSGRESGIVAVQPPGQYPRSVWDELVRCGRLVDSGDGMYELPPE